MLFRLKHLLPLLVILPFSFIVLINSVNFPNGDDFDSLLDFTNRFFQTESKLDQFTLLFERHTQHFRTIDRALAIFSAYFLGGINFNLFFLAGIAGLMLLFSLLTSFNKNKSALFSFTLALLLFQPNYAEVTQWANTCIQGIWVYIFALVAFKLANTKSFLTLVNSCLAILVQGNGMLTIPIILMLKAARLKFDRKFILYLISLLAIFILFRFNQVFTTSGETNNHLLSKILFCLEMLGSSIGYLSPEISLYSGISIALIATCFLITVKEAEEPLVSFLSFLIASCFATAEFRYFHDPNSAFTTSRYTLVSILSVITILCLVHNRSSSHNLYSRLKYVLFLLAFTFNIKNYFYFYDQYTLRQEQLTDSQIRWQLFHTGLLYEPNLRATQILEQTSPTIFNPPPVSLDQVYSKQAEIQLRLDQPKSKIVLSIEHALCNEKHILIDGWAVLKGKNSASNKILLAVNEEYLFESKVRIRPDVNILVSKKAYPKTYQESGFFILINRQELPSSINSLTIFFQGEGNTWSQKSIDPKKLCLTSQASG